MPAGWTCVIRAPSADDDSGQPSIELEQLDSAGTEWFAAGPGGEHLGSDAREVIRLAAGEDLEEEWLECVCTTLAADAGYRSGLVVKRGHGEFFHTSASENRASIRAHGLDWRRYPGRGIAGSGRPEAEGIFLSSDVDSAEWFADMGQRRGHETDIWAVTLNGEWLVSDPSGGGGLDDGWMICTVPIPPGSVSMLLRS